MRNVTKNDITKFLYVLVAIEVGLVVLHLLHFKLYNFLSTLPVPFTLDLFDLDQEANVPTWFSSIQLFMVSTVFFLISAQKPLSSPPTKNFFRLCAGIFLFLSADEAGEIHEKIGWLLTHFDWIPVFFNRYGMWICLYLVTGGFLLIFHYRNLRALIGQYRQESLFIIFGIFFILLGAVGFEILNYQFQLKDTSTTLNFIEVTLEEFCEMFGVSIILYGSLLLWLAGGKADHESRL